MNVLVAGQDSFDRTPFQQLDAFEREIAYDEILVNLTCGREAVVTVDARAQKNLKPSAEAVLVDGGRPIDPVIDIYVKPRPAEKRDRWIAERTGHILLGGQLRGRIYPPNDLPGINPLAWIGFSQRLYCDFGKDFIVIILVTPALFYQRAKVLKELHNLPLVIVS